MKRLPVNLLHKEIFAKFIREYSSCTSYWYVPKARALKDENIDAMKKILGILFNDFLGEVWTTETQDKLLKKLQKEKIVDPYRKDGKLTDRTALSRILKKWIGFFGLLWVKEDSEIIITDIGLELIGSNNPREIIEKQIAKIQYPNPSVSGANLTGFKGILPHLFLLQILKSLNYKLSFDEYEIFINLAQQHDDIDRIVRYIECWRDLNERQQRSILTIVKDLKSRHKRIYQNASYQRAIYLYPNYVSLNNTDKTIIAVSDTKIDEIVDTAINELKITEFSNEEDWFEYFGDPDQKPSWYTYLVHSVEVSKTGDEAAKTVADYSSKINEEDRNILEKKQWEKRIEEFYSVSLDMIERGLKLETDGRQFSTPIGRIDLLCKSSAGEYVVIEIKADEADDSAFGQILRYIGWIHRNLDGGRNNVRGIILAGKFSERARYSQIGLLKKDYKTFLKLMKHDIIPTTI